jgi:hypothetical protein
MKKPLPRGREASLRGRQLDIAWEAPEPFALAIQTSTDGDRVARQEAQAAANRQTAELLQQKIYEQPLQSLPPC